MDIHALNILGSIFIIVTSSNVIQIKINIDCLLAVDSTIYTLLVLDLHVRALAASLFLIL